MQQLVQNLLGRLFNNCGLKLLALLMAVALSTYVYLFVDYPITTSVNLRLRSRNVHEDLAIASPLPDNVRVEVRGPFRSVSALSAGEYNAYVDCTDVQEPGQATLRIELPDFGDVIIVDSEPGALRVSFERKERLPALLIQIYHTPELERNFDIVSEDQTSSTVQISGPQSVVQQIRRAQIEPALRALWLDNQELERSFSEVLPVKLYDEENREISTTLLAIDPREVEYRVTLTPVGARKALRLLPQLADELPEGYIVRTVTVRPTYITVDADKVPDDMESVWTNSISLARRNASFSDWVGLSLPDELRDSSLHELECEVYVEVVSLTEGGAVVLDIELVGKTPQYGYKVEPTQLAVVSERVISLSDDVVGQLAAFIDVTGLEPAEYRVSPQVSLPLEFDNVTIIPDSVVVRITSNGN